MECVYCKKEAGNVDTSEVEIHKSIVRTFAVHRACATERFRASHSPECLKIIDERTIAVVEWGKKWPAHCKTCHGWGAFGSPMGDYEACEECTGHTLPSGEMVPKCARCGATGPAGLSSEDASGPCKTCGWNYNDGEPANAECICYLDNTD